MFGQVQKKHGALFLWQICPVHNRAEGPVEFLRHLFRHHEGVSVVPDRCLMLGIWSQWEEAQCWSILVEKPGKCEGLPALSSPAFAIGFAGSTRLGGSLAGMLHPFIWLIWNQAIKFKSTPVVSWVFIKLNWWGWCITSERLVGNRAWSPRLGPKSPNCARTILNHQAKGTPKTCLQKQIKMENVDFRNTSACFGCGTESVQTNPKNNKESANKSNHCCGMPLPFRSTPGPETSAVFLEQIGVTKKCCALSCLVIS